MNRWVSECHSNQILRKLRAPGHCHPQNTPPNMALRLPPVARAALISATSMATGDAACQLIRARAAGKEFKFNARQSARFGLVGLTLHGPFFFNAFRWLDSRFGTAATLQKAAVKTLTGQFTVFPFYVVGFFLYMGALEGLSAQQCVTKVQHAFPPTFASGSVFWPAANMINFMCVPPSGRVVFVNAAGLLWNGWLSYENSTKGRVESGGSSSSSGSSAASSSSGKEHKK